jgi:hypothetical protein
VIPAFPLLLLRPRCPGRVVVHLVREVGVVRDGRAHLLRRDAQVGGGSIDLAVVAAQRCDELVNVEPGPDQERLPASGRA